MNEDTEPSLLLKIIVTKPFAIVTVPSPLSVNVTFAAQTMSLEKKNAANAAKNM
jgi:hypothetical protein